MIYILKLIILKLTVHLIISMYTHAFMNYILYKKKKKKNIFYSIIIKKKKKTIVDFKVIFFFKKCYMIKIIVFMLIYI